MHYVWSDLETELTNHQFDTVIHRMIALFRRSYIEEVYSHLGDADSLVLEYGRATAVHLYLTDEEGIVIKVRAGHDIGVPSFTEECLTVLFRLDE